MIDHLAQKRIEPMVSCGCYVGVFLGFPGDERDDSNSPERVNTFDSTYDASKARAASSRALLTLNSIFNGRS